MDELKIKKEAEELLNKYGIKEPVVDVFSIAKSEGLDVKFVDMRDRLEDVAGFLDDESKTIFVNNNDSVNRQIFTVAHELGHYVLKHAPDKFGVLYRRRIIRVEDTETEKEADFFAANLLVPEDILEETIKKYKFVDVDANWLAPLFGVSKEVMDYRLRLFNRSR